ncbi:DUF4350 domain-containing protein [Paenibacillus sp.]|uniref:DUF4350 domain-containing protein n=1 Tax=Paenibacillus sp. TaxID=58172 RepID=UPI003565B221
MLKRNKTPIALVLSVAAFLGIGWLLVRPDLPDLPAYVSVSADRDGTKALYTLLEEKNVPVKRWQKPWRFLPKASGQTLVLLQPYSLTEREREEIVGWVERGNELLVFDSSPEGWTTFPAAALDEPDPGVVPVTDLRRPAETGFTGRVASAYRLDASSGMEPVLRDARGVIGGHLAVGEGSLSLFVVPEWTMNEHVLEHSHFELLWPYLNRPSGALWVDEYHHGLQDKPGLLAVYPDWLLAVLLQLLLAVLLWLWRKAVRFGPAFTPRAWTVRRGDETLLAAAGWYERGRLTREALAHQERYVRSRLRARFGVRTDASDAQVLAAAKRHWDKAAVDRLAALLACWRAAEEAVSYTPKQLEMDSRKADEVIRNLEKE